MKTLFTQRPTRLACLPDKLLAMAVCARPSSVTTLFGLSAVSSLLIAVCRGCIYPTFPPPPPTWRPVSPAGSP